MKFLNKILITNNFFQVFIVFFKFKFFMLQNLNMFFCRYQYIFNFFYHYYYFIKYNNKIYSLYIIKSNYVLYNLSFFFIQKIKQQFYSYLIKCTLTFILRGRGFRFLSLENNLYTFKLGFSHLINLKLNKILSMKTFSKNFQKFQIIGSIFQVIQVYSCLYILKKKNIFTSKGIFVITEKLKNENLNKKL